MTKHCTLWALRDRPWHLPYNGQVHLLPKRYCWLSLRDLRAHPIWNSKWEVPLQGALCLLCSPAAREKQSPAVFPRNGPWWVLWVMGRSQIEGNLQDFKPKLWFDLNFYPPKICSWKITSFSFAISSSDLTIYESLQIPVTFIVQILMSLISYVWSTCLYCFSSKILNWNNSPYSGEQKGLGPMPCFAWGLSTVFSFLKKSDTIN